jgi:Recombinase/Recombinase zinc beta ribbon domain
MPGRTPTASTPPWGRRAHRLEPDPQTAPVVKWIFAQRLAGHSLARITRALNEAGIPCPSAADPDRNAHRTGERWSLTTVRAILANPRYSGRQVWNRQPTAMDLIDPANTGLGHRQVQRRGLPEGWVISARPAHPALVSEADFIAAHGIRATRDDADPGRQYRLSGLLRCGICGRRLESCWSNGRPAYRCRHAHSSASAPDPGRPKNLYIREDRILPHLPALHLLLAAAGPAAGRRRRRTRHGADVNPSGQRGGRDQLPARPADHSHLPRPPGPCRQTHLKTPRPSSASQANLNGAHGPGNPKEKRRKGGGQRADRPVLTEAWARVTCSYAQKRTFMYRWCVRGATAPKNQCLLAAELAFGHVA